MTEKEIQQIVFNLIVRVQTGFFFIENYIQQDRGTAPDLAAMRSLYILQSFHFELLLKALHVLLVPYPNSKELEVSLKMMGHDLKAIMAQCGDLLEFNIRNITSGKGEFMIETSLRKFKIYDFVDIRYDFIENKQRIVGHDAYKEIIEGLEGGREIISRILPLLKLLPSSI